MPRPGVPDWYTGQAALRLLGYKSTHLLRRLIRRRLLKADQIRHGARVCYRVWRADLIAFMRAEGYPPAAYRGLQPAPARVAVVSADAKLRRAAARFPKVDVGSVFQLGRVYETTPLWCVVLDLAAVGREAAVDVARRLTREGDHPLLVAVTADDGDAGVPGLWDLVLHRPCHPGKIAACLLALRKTVSGGDLRADTEVPTHGRRANRRRR